jgi:hypothetical protein
VLGRLIALWLTVMERLLVMALTFLPPTGSLQTQASHRALDRAAGNGHLISFQLAPSFLGAVDLHVFLANSLNLGHRSFIALSALTAQ